MDFSARKSFIKTCVVLWILVEACSLSAGTQQESFLKAQAYYQEGNVAKALELYQSIPIKSMAISYNMGNCYYANRNIPLAILHWLRAQKNASMNEFKTLETYIQQAYADKGIAYHATLLSRMYHVLMHLIMQVPLIVWQFLWLFCWILLLVRSVSWFYRSKYGALAVIVLFFGVLCAVNLAYYRNQNHPKGIVTKNSISVYAGPCIDYAIIGTAKALDSMRVYTVNSGWLMLYMSGLGYGWVQEKDFVII